jgi:hypothetical protein
MQTFHEWMEAHVRGTVTGDPLDRDWYLKHAASKAQSADTQARRDGRADMFVSTAKWFADQFRKPNFAADVSQARDQIEHLKSAVEGITHIAEKEIEYIVDRFHTPDSKKKNLEPPRFFR